MAYAITDFSHVYINYQDDAGAFHKVSQRTAVQTAVTNSTTIDGGATLGRPSKWKLRHIQLYNKDGTTGYIRRKRVVIADPTNTLFVDGGTVTGLDGINWTVEGRIGERRQN